MNVGFELVEVNALKLSDRNPNSGDIQQIVESIRANGFYSYIVARKGTREVLVGNHRLQAAIQAGMSKVPVIWVEADEKQAAWLLAQDNRLAAFGYRDERTLMELFQEMNGIEGTGYTQADLDDLETWMRRLSPAANPAIKPNTEDEERFNQGTYTISFVFEPATYPRVIELMDKLATHHGVSSYADAILAECRDYGHQA